MRTPRIRLLDLTARPWVVGLTAGLLTGGLLGCEGESSSNGPQGGACQAAANHIAGCVGQAPAEASPECDQEQAAQVVTQDCEQITAASEAAKADGWWDLWMSQWCGWWGVYCGPTSTAGVIEVSATSEWGFISTYDVSVRCAFVRVLDGTGNEVATAYTSPAGRVTFDDLAAGRYTVQMLDRAGEVVTQRQIESTTSKATWTYLRIPGNLDLSVRHCVPARGKLVTFRCDEEAPADSQEWAVRIVPAEDSQLIDDVFWGTWNNSIRPAAPKRVWQSEFFTNYLPLGRYDVEFVRLDLPSGNNLDMTKEIDRSWNKPESAGFASIELTADMLVPNESGSAHVDIDLGVFEIDDPRPSNLCDR